MREMNWDLTGNAVRWTVKSHTLCPTSQAPLTELLFLFRLDLSPASLTTFTAHQVQEIENDNGIVLYLERISRNLTWLSKASSNPLALIRALLQDLVKAHSPFGSGDKKNGGVVQCDSCSCQSTSIYIFVLFGLLFRFSFPVRVSIYSSQNRRTKWPLKGP